MNAQLVKRWMPMAAVAMVTALVISACSDGGSDPPQANGGNNSLTTELAKLSGISIQSQQQTGIWVDGSGSVKVTPDVATLNLGVEARAVAVADARDQAARAMDGVMKSLKDNGVADKDIQTRGFNIQPIIVYVEVTPLPGDRNRPTEPRITGYIVSNSIKAKVRKLDTVGKAIDDAVKAGGNNIRFNGVSFSIDNPKPLETEARKLALEDAKAKAQQAAQVMGVKLGEPSFIQLTGGSPIVQEKFIAAAPRPAASDGAITTPISGGELDVIVHVQVTFTIS
jgi:uncharacterized protein YggE